MAITKEQIFAVADDLDAAGQNPTWRACASSSAAGASTISEAMNEWRARKASQAAPIREPAPAAITEKLAELGGDLWAVALEMANNRLAAEREALEAVRQETEAARQEAAELADQLTGELDEAKGRIAALEAAEAPPRGSRGAAREAGGGQRARRRPRPAPASCARSWITPTRKRARRGERDKAQEKAAASADQVEALRADLAAANSRATEIERRAGELRADLERANQAAAERQKAARPWPVSLTRCAANWRRCRPRPRPPTARTRNSASRWPPRRTARPSA
jgi:chromosome segregation ATPase